MAGVARRARVPHGRGRATPGPATTARPVAGRTTGRWVDGHDWVVSIWRHHTSRDGDPQLHVHAAVVNRVRCPDGVWRSLDSQAIASARPAVSTATEI